LRHLFKEILVLTLVFSVVLTFIIIPIRYDYVETAPFEKADYDIFVNGLITVDDYNQIFFCFGELYKRKRHKMKKQS